MRSLILTVLLLAAGASAETLHVRADAWFPVNGDPASVRPGFAIELLHRIFAPLDIDLDYQLVGWSRALEMANSGETDCVIGSYKSEAPNLVFPDTPLAFDSSVFYVLRDQPWRYSGVKSLHDVSVAVIAGYNYGRDVDAWVDSGPANAVIAHGRNPLRNNLRMLLAGRVDTLLESPLVMRALLEEQGLEGRVIEAGRIDEQQPFYFACTPQGERGKRFVRLYNEGVRRLRQGGEEQEIYQRYRVSEPLPTP